MAGIKDEKLKNILELDNLSTIEQEEVLSDIKTTIILKYDSNEIFSGNIKEANEILNNLDEQVIIDEAKKVVDNYIKESKKFNCIVKEVERYFNTYNLTKPTHDKNKRYAREIAMYLCFKYIKLNATEKSRRFNIENTAIYVHWYYDYQSHIQNEYQLYIQNEQNIKKDIKTIIDRLDLKEE